MKRSSMKVFQRTGRSKQHTRNRDSLVYFMQMHFLYTQVIPLSGRLTTELKTRDTGDRQSQRRKKEGHKGSKKPCFNCNKSTKENNTINLRCYLDIPSGRVELLSNAPCFPKVGMLLLERFFTRMLPEVGTLFSFFSLRKEV